jgi:hypothetical protein
MNNPCPLLLLQPLKNFLNLHLFSLSTFSTEDSCGRDLLILVFIGVIKVILICYFQEFFTPFSPMTVTFNTN